MKTPEAGKEAAAGPRSAPVLVSACLLGLECAYHGRSNRNERLLRLLEGRALVPVCPEQLGGLPTPRDRARLVGGEGRDVLAGRARVLTFRGEDVTEAYLKGARETLKAARLSGARLAVLKANSPSCGCGAVYTEDFSALKAGDGTTAALLKENGVRVVTEEDGLPAG